MLHGTPCPSGHCSRSAAGRPPPTFSKGSLANSHAARSMAMAQRWQARWGPRGGQYSGAWSASPAHMNLRRVPATTSSTWWYGSQEQSTCWGQSGPICSDRHCWNSPSSIAGGEPNRREDSLKNTTAEYPMGCPENLIIALHQRHARLGTHTNPVARAREMERLRRPSPRQRVRAIGRQSEHGRVHRDKRSSGRVIVRSGLCYPRTLCYFWECCRLHA
ncbi:unnamed protein product [Ectocarpus sp. 6 AP-2014]